MKKIWNLDEILKATKGQALSSPNMEFSGFGTDTRANLNDQVFIALRGQSFDGHDFLVQALRQGAKGILVDQWDGDEVVEHQVSVIRVEDTLQALQDLAHYWRKQLDAQVIAISGSNGKTTTKDFVHTLLGTRYKTLASQGSFNNHWGVPLTLLCADSDHEKIVLEMGMNHKGELTRLCEIAEPEVTHVTNVGSAHVGELGSVRAVAEAKQELYTSAPEGIQIFNLDNEFTEQMYRQAMQAERAKKIYTYSSFRMGVDVSFRVTRMDLFSIEVKGFISSVDGLTTVPVFGRQNVNNLMAAAAIALAAGMKPTDIWEVLAQCRTSWGRNQLVELNSGTQVLFDAYNANPESLSALIKNMFELEVAGKKVFVVGEMLELGEERAKAHFDMAEMIGNTDADLVWFIGPSQADFKAGLAATEFKKTSFFSDSYEQSLAIKIGSMLNQQDVAVIKGSRGMCLERVLRMWQAADRAAAKQ